MGAGFAVGCALASLFLAIFACLLAAVSLIDVHAFRRSTHNIQFVPADKPAAEFDKTLAKHEQELYDNLEHSYPGKEETI